MAQFKCRGEVILPFAISRNLAIVEIICLQLDEFDVETVYTLAYILKLYPPLFSLKSISEHYYKIQLRLGYSAQIETVMHLHMTVLGIPLTRRLHVPNITVYDFKEGNGPLFASSKYWRLELHCDGFYNYFLLDCLIKCGGILVSKARSYAATKIRNVSFNVELIGDFWCEFRNESYLQKLRKIRSARFEITRRKDIRSTLWTAISTLFMNILNCEDLLPHSVYNLTMYIECRPNWI